MALSKEFLRPAETKPGFFPSNSSFSKEKVNILPIEETRKKNLRKDGFEPFVNPPPTEKPLFVNVYSGNFAQQMQLNRTEVERVLTIAHLDGQVFLTNLTPNRQRSIEANPDGSVTRKRSLLFGEKMEEDEKDNPYLRIVSIPQGWRIEINDTRIREELMEKDKANVRRTQKTFIRKFDGLVRRGIRDCVLQEKLSSTKDKDFRKRLLQDVWWNALRIADSATLMYDVRADPRLTGIVVVSAFIAFAFQPFENIAVNITFDSRRSPTRKNVDHFWEIFMPFVEIDKVARSLAFLGLKGRTLVRETKQQENK